MIELGVAWLPGLLWRLDSDWKSLRSEVPWVKRPPSEIVHEHVRLTTQPLEDPPNGRQLKMFLECFPAFKDILMFATDYPHWDSEAPELIARKLPDGWSDAVLSENARRHYPKLPSRAPEPDEAIAVLGS
jgi:predicted TIM-barrel fold metal-dependent hydrolase